MLFSDIEDHFSYINTQIIFLVEFYALKLQKLYRENILSTFTFTFFLEQF